MTVEVGTHLGLCKLFRWDIFIFKEDTYGKKRLNYRGVSDADKLTGIFTTLVANAREDGVDIGVCPCK